MAATNQNNTLPLQTFILAAFAVLVATSNAHMPGAMQADNGKPIFISSIYFHSHALHNYYCSLVLQIFFTGTSFGVIKLADQLQHYFASLTH